METLRLTVINILMLTAISLSAQKPDNYDAELKNLYNNTVELITPDELSEEMNDQTDLVLLDTREKNEYKTSHIENARFVGYNTFDISSLDDISKDTPIVVYCSLGVRSEKVGEQLKNAGFTNVKNLYGGIFEWVYHNKPVYDKKGRNTSRVHTYNEAWSKWLLKGEKIY